MRIKIPAVILIAVWNLGLHAQSPDSKMNISLKNLLSGNVNQQAPNAKLSGQEIAVFVRGDIEEIKRKTQELGGVFKYAAGDIAAIRLPLGKVTEIAALPSVTRVENNDLKLQPLLDQAIISTHVLEVHNGFGLPQGYDGKGVVVGIIDEGIDWKHPDFRNLDGTTRIKYLWDQTILTLDSGIMPQPYNYGVEFVGSQIDTSTQHYDANGHGTHVAGIACGNGHALNNYYGTAPASDIMVVKMNLSGTTNNFLNSLADAVKYIFDKADSLHEPAVINISLGTYFGSHDGKDAQSQIIGNLVNDSIGRVVVAAAGNAGYAAIHLGYNATSDTSLTWFQVPNDGGGHPTNSYLDIWGDVGDFENIQFAIGVDEIIKTQSSGIKYRHRGSTPFQNVAGLLSNPNNDTLYNDNNQRLAVIFHQVQIVNGSYELEFSIKPDSALSVSGGDSSIYRWSLMVTGNGRLDCWSFDMVADGLPDTNAFPPIQFYKKPDSWQNMVSSFQCNDKVITVGSYDNRRNYTNANFLQTYDTLYPPYTRIYPGALSAFSSHGPTRDNRTKPDVTAPGGWVLAAGPDYVLNSLLAIGPEKVAAGRMHFRNSGTSMASPMVAGICALYLQKNPSASWLDVKNALLSCTTKDSYTGNSLPDNMWGNGKANAYQMITGCAIGVEELAGNWQLEAYPNPFSDFTTISYNLPSLAANNKAEIRIVDAIGKTIKNISLNDRINSIKIGKGELKSGIYFYSLIVNDRLVKTSKLAVM